MHNSKGAFSETVYIYGTAIEFAITRGFSMKFISLGLGLGYNELLCTSLLLKHSVPLAEVYGQSYEAVSELNHTFSKWLRSETIAPDFQSAYDMIVNLCAVETQQESSLIKFTLSQLVANRNWKLGRALDAETTFDQKFSCYMFDAFSSKTSPELWEENFLTSFFQSTAADQAVISTYASTGALKRSLTKNNFKVEIKTGFSGKRESTFAVKGTK